MIDFSRQDLTSILTSKVGPRAEKVNEHYNSAVQQLKLEFSNLCRYGRECTRNGGEEKEHSQADSAAQIFQLGQTSWSEYKVTTQWYVC